MIHVDFYRILMPTCQHLQCVKTEPIWCRGSHCNFAGCFLFRVYCVQRKLEKGQRLLPIISWWKWEMPSWDGLPMQNKVRKNMFKVLLKKMEVCPMITLEMLRTAHTSRLVRLFLHAAHFLNFCIAFTPNLLSLLSVFNPNHTIFPPPILVRLTFLDDLFWGVRRGPLKKIMRSEGLNQCAMF